MLFHKSLGVIDKPPGTVRWDLKIWKMVHIMSIKLVHMGKMHGLWTTLYSSRYTIYWIIFKSYISRFCYFSQIERYVFGNTNSNVFMNFDAGQWNNNI